MVQVRMLIFIAIAISTATQITGSNNKKCSYINYRGKNVNENHHKRKCSAHESCGRRLTISYIDIPPYSTCQVFERVVEGCCGYSESRTGLVRTLNDKFGNLNGTFGTPNGTFRILNGSFGNLNGRSWTPCTNFTVISIYKNISEVELSETSSPDFILPFLGNSRATDLYGYHFIPFADLPYAYYITHKHASRMTRMINNCLGLHPLILFCLLAAVVSGFIIWAIETLSGKKGSNSDPFLVGLFEGFWWSFTSVTSGYGAKIIHSVPAKLYAVLWILVGVIMFSLMTSSFTAELMASMQPLQDSMSGATVGVLKYRDYDASLVVREGGVVKETDASNFHADVLTLIHMLRTKQISGMVLDKYTLAYTRGYLDWKKHNIDHFVNNSAPGTGETYEHRRTDIDNFLEHTGHTMKLYGGEKLSYGVLVKRSEDYEHFNNAVRDNRLSLETATESEMNQIFPRDKEESFLEPTNGLHFGVFLRLVGGLVACICGLGVAFEIYQKKQCRVLPMVDETMSRLVDAMKGETPL